MLPFLGALFFLFLGAIPLLPLCVKPLEDHRDPKVRGTGKLLAWGLLWLTFDCSLLAIWGAFHYEPTWWAALIGLPLLQGPAAWVSHRVVFG